MTKIQLIQLMSPEFQIYNKMIGRNVPRHAENADDVAVDQHGSRVGVGVGVNLSTHVSTRN